MDDKWDRGAAGERLVGATLAKIPALLILHDRQVPKSEANVDHLLVTPAAVWVLDAKAWNGRIELDPERGLLQNGRKRDATGTLRWVSDIIADLDLGLPVRAALVFPDDTDMPAGVAVDRDGIRVARISDLTPLLFEEAPFTIEQGRRLLRALAETFRPADKRAASHTAQPPVEPAPAPSPQSSAPPAQVLGQQPEAAPAEEARPDPRPEDLDRSSDVVDFERQLAVLSRQRVAGTRATLVKVGVDDGTSSVRLKLPARTEPTSPVRVLPAGSSVVLVALIDGIPRVARAGPHHPTGVLFGVAGEVVVGVTRDVSGTAAFTLPLAGPVPAGASPGDTVVVEALTPAGVKVRAAASTPSGRTTVVALSPGPDRAEPPPAPPAAPAEKDPRPEQPAGTRPEEVLELVDELLKQLVVGAVGRTTGLVAADEGGHARIVVPVRPDPDGPQVIGPDVDVQVRATIDGVVYVRPIGAPVSRAGSAAETTAIPMPPVSEPESVPAKRRRRRKLPTSVGFWLVIGIPVGAGVLAAIVILVLYLIYGEIPAELLEPQQG